MRRASTLFLALLTPWLMATDISQSGGNATAATTEAEKRAELDRYVFQLSAVIESQIEEIASLIPDSDVDRLRETHAGWKLARDADCLIQGNRDAWELSELECLSIKLEDYYQAREMEIADLEEQQGIRAPVRARRITSP
jgi:hypothetical protein